MRKHYHKKKRLYQVTFILTIFILIISVSYAYLSTQLNITGQVRGITQNTDFIIDPDSNPNLRINKPTINKWQENNKYKYQYTFILSNIGNIDYDNFTVTIWFNNNITLENSWNYTFTTKTNVLTIINTQYDLLANNSLEIGFIVYSNKANLSIQKIKLEAKTTTQEIDPSKFIVVFNRTNGWGSYTYQYSVQLTNKTGQQITYWQLDIVLPTGTTFVSGWNGIFEVKGSSLIVKNESYNGRLNNDESTSFGMQLNTNIVNYLPSNPKVTIR